MLGSTISLSSLCTSSALVGKSEEAELLSLLWWKIISFASTGDLGHHPLLFTGLFNLILSCAVMLRQEITTSIFLL